jgi:serine protease Do
MLKDLLPQLKKGNVERGWLGVTVQPIDEKLAKSFGLKEPKGALIADVIKGDPADKAGVKAGDIVIAIDGKPVNTHKDLINIIGHFLPNKTVKLTLIRDGKEKIIKVKLGLRKDRKVASNNAINKNAIISVQTLTEQEKKTYGVDNGVKVVNVKSNSAAYEAGVRTGNVIVWINRKTITNANEFYKVYDNIKKGDVVALKIVSKGGSRFIAFNKD